jgi:hypothetical protein
LTWHRIYVRLKASYLGASSVDSWGLLGDKWHSENGR